MERQGGSITRVFSGIDLPLAILDEPEIVIPLRDQFRLLERAAVETGDACFGARLGQEVRMKELSTFGTWVCSADTLLKAIERAHAGLNVMLQTSTNLTLERRGASVRWAIEFLEPETEGRHHNELLGVSYMIDTVRTYAGKRWHPEVVMTTRPTGAPRTSLEELFNTNISNGHALTAIEFDFALLNCVEWRTSPEREVKGACDGPMVPQEDDMLGAAAAVADLALYDGYPRIDWVAAKLGMNRRSLQRQLARRGKTFRHLIDDRLHLRAQMMLQVRSVTITEVAVQLGYCDLAHFTRAFRRWTGVSPSAYRRAKLSSDAPMN